MNTNPGSSPEPSYVPKVRISTNTKKIAAPPITVKRTIITAFRINVKRATSKPAKAPLPGEKVNSPATKPATNQETIAREIKRAIDPVRLVKKTVRTISPTLIRAPIKPPKAVFPLVILIIYF